MPDPRASRARASGLAIRSSEHSFPPISVKKHPEPIVGAAKASCGIATLWIGRIGCSRANGTARRYGHAIARCDGGSDGTGIASPTLPVSREELLVHFGYINAALR